MTYRERMERKAAKRLEWAKSARRKSEAGFNAARAIADHIPLGQPILVGHHSEKHHRRDIARIDAGMRKGCEMAEKARDHESKSAGLSSALERAIYDDDPDAIARLTEKAEEIEADCARKVAINKDWRKRGHLALMDAHGINEDAAKAMHEKIMAGYSWCRQPYPSFELTNARATARNARKRIEVVKARQTRAALAEASPTGVVVFHDGADYCRIQFAEKPSRAIIDALKANGFYWGRGMWGGRKDAIPDAVRELIPAEAVKLA